MARSKRCTVRSNHWMPLRSAGSGLSTPARRAGAVTCQFVSRLALAKAQPLPAMPHARAAYFDGSGIFPKAIPR